MDPNKNGQDYEKNLLVWFLIVVIILASIAIMSQIFFKNPWQYLQ